MRDGSQFPLGAQIFGLEIADLLDISQGVEANWTVKTDCDCAGGFLPAQTKPGE